MKRWLMAAVCAVWQAYYRLCRLAPMRRRVVMMSRELDTEPLDFRLLREEIGRQDDTVEVVTLCKTMGHGLALLGYVGHLLRCTAVLATASVCVVDTYCLPVSLLRHRPSLRVVQIWHALGTVKQFGYQSLGLEEGRDAATAALMRMHRGYTDVFCAGQAIVPFFAAAFRIAPARVTVIGMPRIDWLLSDQTALCRRILSAHPRLKEKPVVLYVPTFRAHQPTVGDDLIRAVDPDAYTLVISAHPVSTASIPAAYTVPGFSSTELLAVADAVVTDYSAIAFEAALQRKKLYFYLYDYEDYRYARGLNIDPMVELPAACATDPASLARLLDAPYPAAERDAFCRRYVDTADTQNAARIAEWIRDKLPNKK